MMMIIITINPQFMAVTPLYMRDHGRAIITHKDLQRSVLISRKALFLKL